MSAAQVMTDEEMFARWRAPTDVKPELQAVLAMLDALPADRRCEVLAGAFGKMFADIRAVAWAYSTERHQ